MGQSYIICNLDKRESLRPDWFGQGNHLPDLSRPGDGIMTGLAVLLALSGSGLYRGGSLYGRWAGDRIALVGSYYGGSSAGYQFTDSLHNEVFEQEGGWIDISEHVRALLEHEWGITFPASNVDGSERRWLLNEDGTLTMLPRAGGGSGT